MVVPCLKLKEMGEISALSETEYDDLRRSHFLWPPFVLPDRYNHLATVGDKRYLWVANSLIILHNLREAQQTHNYPLGLSLHLMGLGYILLQGQIAVA